MAQGSARDVSGSRSSMLLALGAGAAVVLAIAFGGGLLIGLSPVVCAALAVVVIAGTVVLSWARARRSGRATSGSVAALGHYVVVGVATLVLIQLVPYGRAHSNPVGAGEPAWSSPRTRELMVDSCFACHSNSVTWPWYSNVAPMSWAVTAHVDEGRSAVNYSDFVADPGEAEESIEVIEDGSMPPGYFTRFGLHPEANLTDAEVAELIAGLRATPGLADEGDGGGEGGGEGGGGDDDGD